jgi:predicted DNA-binding protein
MISAMPVEDDARFVRLPIGFPPELYEWLRKTAFRRRRPMAEVVREAVQEYRERQEPQLTLPMGRHVGDEP